MPDLIRISDGAGDSGAMSMLFKVERDGDGYWSVSRDEDGLPITKDGEPEVGYVIRVGSLGARSYQSQDWWQTTPIVEIVNEDTVDGRRRIEFLTASNSRYYWVE